MHFSLSGAWPQKKMMMMVEIERIIARLRSQVLLQNSKMFFHIRFVDEGHLRAQELRFFFPPPGNTQTRGAESNTILIPKTVLGHEDAWKPKEGRKARTASPWQWQRTKGFSRLRVRLSGSPGREVQRSPTPPATWACCVG